MLKDSIEDSYDLPLVRNILVFISNQEGYWSAEWLFSLSDSPKYEAHSEMKEWGRWWEAFVKTMNDLNPEIHNLMLKNHDITLTQYCLIKRVEFNDKNRLAKCLTYLQDSIAKFLHKIGIKSISVYFQGLSLYPKGTVGRIGPSKDALDKELDDIRNQRDEIIDKAASEGKTVPIDSAIKELDALLEANPGDEEIAAVVETKKKELLTKYKDGMPIEVAYQIMKEAEEKFGWDAIHSDQEE